MFDRLYGRPSALFPGGSLTGSTLNLLYRMTEILSSLVFRGEKLGYLVKKLSKSPTRFVKSSKEKIFAQI